VEAGVTDTPDRDLRPGAIDLNLATAVATTCLPTSALAGARLGDWLVALSVPVADLLCSQSGTSPGSPTPTQWWPRPPLG